MKICRYLQKILIVHIRATSLHQTIAGGIEHPYFHIEALEELAGGKRFIVEGGAAIAHTRVQLVIELESKAVAAAAHGEAFLIRQYKQIILTAPLVALEYMIRQVRVTQSYFTMENDSPLQ